MLRLEKRPTPSRFWLYATPPVAVVLTMIVGGILFAAMGKNPFEVIRTIFWDPVFGEFAFYLRGQLLVKAGPLILIAIGLALGFRAGIWNIGAEGQYIMGAICGAAVGLAVFPTENRLIYDFKNGAMDFIWLLPEGMKSGDPDGLEGSWQQDDGKGTFLLKENRKTGIFEGHRRKKGSKKSEKLKVEYCKTQG